MDRTEQIDSEAAAVTMLPKEKPPKHPFELSLQIGGETWELVVHELYEMARHVEEHGPNCTSFGGGGGTAHTVTIEKRDISPADYRKELQDWFERQRV